MISALWDIGELLSSYSDIWKSSSLRSSTGISDMSHRIQRNVSRIKACISGFARREATVDDGSEDDECRSRGGDERVWCGQITGQEQK
ncbi:uncharacterized protein L3040_000824 [Drepanopeziza brunnea f. sp. 'multigermtubi']|uniref:uncharacterized protein n=1 Tax=Drepanopeziza brunnea f. sp. 'multigermtubi' TaxID=698441 RepID=UPI00239353C0|nr:hypothetical protein L3040_000824 [Drepanopeziza brunnea f. sp. 'multigermtubi']